MFMKRVIFSAKFKKIEHPLLPDIRKNRIFAVFIFTLFAGIVAGAFSGRNSDNKMMEKLDIVFQTNFKVRCTQGMIDAFVASFASAFIFILVIFLAGLSLWGGIVTVFIPFVKGYGYGLSVGYLYCTYGIQGIFYNILVILPGAFLCSAVICASAQESVRNTFRLISLFRKTAVSDDPRLQMKHYMLSMLYFLFIASLSSAVDMLFSFFFSWIFRF